MVLILPKADDIRAARAYLSWKQPKLAVLCDVNVGTIIAIEKGKSKPSKELLEKMAEVFLEQGVKFQEQGGFIRDKNTVTIYEGEGCYLKVQQDILSSCSLKKTPAYFLGVDDRKSTKEVLENEKKLYEVGVDCKYLVDKNNDYLIAPIEEYRAVDKKFFVPSDLTVIYGGTKVAFDVCRTKDTKITNKIIVLNDEHMYNRMKDYFEDLWGDGKIISKSSAKQIFFKEIKKDAR